MRLKNILHFIYYLAYKFFNFLFLAIPKPISKYILIGLAHLAYHLGFERRKICRANLDFVYGSTKTKEQKEEIIKKSYITLLFNMYEFIENQTLSKEEILAKAKVENEHYLIDAIKNNRKIIFIASHFGGWEIAMPYVAAKYGKTGVVGKDMKNPYIQKNYKSLREKNNIDLYSKNSSAKKLIKAMQEETPVIIAVDQHTNKGTKLEFLGKESEFIDSASRLALRFDALLIPAFAITNDFRDYIIKVCKPIDPKKMDFNGEQNTEKKITQLTKEQAKAIEKEIFARPEQWLWQHKRWKKYHGKIYK